MVSCLAVCRRARRLRSVGVVAHGLVVALLGARVEGWKFDTGSWEGPASVAPMDLRSIVV